jgi:hypothetical protein
MFIFESDTRQVPMNCRTRRNHLTPPHNWSFHLPGSSFRTSIFAGVLHPAHTRAWTMSPWPPSAKGPSQGPNRLRHLVELGQGSQFEVHDQIPFPVHPFHTIGESFAVVFTSRTRFSPEGFAEPILTTRRCLPIPSPLWRRQVRSSHFPRADSRIGKASSWTVPCYRRPGWPSTAKTRSLSFRPAYKARPSRLWCFPISCSPKKKTPPLASRFVPTSRVLTPCLT